MATSDAMLFDVFNSRRELVGRLVRDEVFRRGLTIKEAGQLTHTSTPLLNRLFRGEPNVTDVSLRAIEGGFEWPLRFLSYILDGNTEVIEQLEGLRPDLRQFVLYELRHLPNPDGDQIVNSE